MRISFMIFICFSSFFAYAKDLSFSDLLKVPSKEVKLEDYLKVTERESLNSITDALRSTQLVRSMENLNKKDLESKSILEKTQNIKSRINLLSKTLLTVNLTIAETFIYVITLQDYFELGNKLETTELDKFAEKIKVELFAKKQAIFEKMLNHDFEIFKIHYGEIAGMIKKSGTKKEDKDYISPEDVRNGLLELEKMKQVVSQNHKCLLDKSCHYCGLNVSHKSCKSDTKERLNELIVDRINEASVNFNIRFEKWTH